MDKIEKELRDILANAVQGFYWCDRVWSAWSYGTMTEDDFYPAEDDEDWINETVGSILKFKDEKIKKLQQDCKNLIEINNNQAETNKNIIDIRNKYGELLLAVHTKFSNESRHETALRYIKSVVKDNERAGKERKYG